MPYASDAQRKYFNANRAKLEAEGVDVDEYNAASKGMDLPEHAPKSEHHAVMDHIKKLSKKKDK